MSFRPLKVHVLLVLRCNAIWETRKRSGFFHLNAGWGLFAAWPVYKGSIADYYHHSLVYHDLCSGGPRFKMHGKTKMTETWEMFLKWTNRLPETAADRITLQHSVWIVPASFCAIPLCERRELLAMEKTRRWEEAKETEAQCWDLSDGVPVQRYVFYVIQAPSNWSVAKLGVLWEAICR